MYKIIRALHFFIYDFIIKHELVCVLLQLLILYMNRPTSAARLIERVVQIQKYSLESLLKI